eukprot:gene10619-10429_t
MQAFSELRLPNGSVLPNRLAKAAMEENLADAEQAPSDALIHLYERWAEGGVGLMITGNVMIDRRAMTGPGGVVLEDAAHGARFRRWASVARAHGGQIWMQLNHPGRQMPAALGQPTLAPSALAMDLGNFSGHADDARGVVEMLNPLGVDLLELSGGSYEAPAMMGLARDERTLAREAYFLEFAQALTQVAHMPLMVTGGIRRLPVVEQVLASGVALAGMATALSITPDLPRRWQSDPAVQPLLRAVTWQDKVMASAAHMAMVKHQLRRLSRGKASAPQVSPLYALIAQQLGSKLQNWRYRQRMRQRGATV